MFHVKGGSGNLQVMMRVMKNQNLILGVNLWNQMTNFRYATYAIQNRKEKNCSGVHAVVNLYIRHACVVPPETDAISAI